MKRSFIALLIVLSIVCSLCLLASCGGGNIQVDEGMPEENPIPEITVRDNPNDPDASGGDDNYTDPQ